MSTNAEAVARAAARWWTDAIRQRKFDNGADDERNVMAQHLARAAAEMAAPTDAALTAFEDALVLRLVEERERSTRSLRLSSDYGPGWLLAAAAKEAALSPLVFPWKTNMRIDFDSGRVEASLGYGAAYADVPVQKGTP